MWDKFGYQLCLLRIICTLTVGSSNQKYHHQRNQKNYKIWNGPKICSQIWQVFKRNATIYRQIQEINIKICSKSPTFLLLIRKDSNYLTQNSDLDKPPIKLSGLFLKKRAWIVIIIDKMK